MSKNIKRAISLSVVIIIIIIAIISTFFIVKHIESKIIIDNVISNYSNNIIQDVIDNETTTGKKENDIINELTLKIDGENVLGVITIEKINFEGLVYKGTSLETLDKGVGHMDSSPYFSGNVCLAAHNTKELWGNLHELQNGDKIIYTSFLGTKEYEVTNIIEIDETDWSLLQDTEENKLTLITCIKNKPFSRLCVQATEVV